MFSNLEPTSYIADNALVGRVLRYSAWYLINQITRSNGLCRGLTFLQPVAANCVGWGNRRLIQIVHISHANARKRAMTQILTPAFINANGNDLKWSRSRFKRRCQCQVYCQWYNLSLLFYYLSEFGS